MGIYGDTAGQILREGQRQVMAGGSFVKHLQGFCHYFGADSVPRQDGDFMGPRGPWWLYGHAADFAKPRVLVNAPC